MAPYDEATIVSLMTEIYTILQKLCYIEPSHINYPTPAGHTLNQPLCASLNLSPAVISLIQKLPCPVDAETAVDFDFLLESRTVVYTNDGDLQESRDQGRDILRGCKTGLSAPFRCYVDDWEIVWFITSVRYRN
jgi:hypothetical protein